MTSPYKVVLFSCLFFLFAIYGTSCNEFSTIINIQPSKEIKAGRVVIASQTFSVRIPDNWEIHWVHLNENNALIDIDLMLKGETRIGGISFINHSKQPEWVDLGHAKKISTGSHKEVQYTIEDTTAPSGDDTPGQYSLRAWLPDHHWEMSVGFTHPVAPNIEEAVHYIDCLNFVNDK